MGIERRQNGVLDGDVPAPSLRIARAEPNFIVAWPTKREGFVLESRAGFPHELVSESEPSRNREQRIYVTNAARLRTFSSG
jgi:hypothetical protein